MVPHGLLELSLIMVAGAAGLRMGAAILMPGRRDRRDALRERCRDSVKLVLGCAPPLLLAAWVEGFISPIGTIASSDGFGSIDDTERCTIALASFSCNQM